MDVRDTYIHKQNMPQTSKKINIFLIALTFEILQKKWTVIQACLLMMFNILLMSNPYALVKCVTDALKAHIRMYESHCAVRETGNIHTRPQR